MTAALGTIDNVILRPGMAKKGLRILLCVAAVILLFSLYTWGISRNPPGFYIDESMTAYNAYHVSRTGAGEFGPRFPILFQAYAVSNALPATIMPIARLPEMRFANTPSSRHAANIQKAAHARATGMLG